MKPYHSSVRVLTPSVAIINTATIKSRTLEEVVCSVNPAKCKPQLSVVPVKKSRTRSSVKPYGGPSREEFQRWQTYEETAQGTGFLHDMSGNNPVPYGPGLGNIGIFSNVDVNYGIGSFNYQRDFGISMGGNGRIGGIPVGWGNGGTRSLGSAWWMHE
ncbi:unnamed protein product [Caenorhabditis bovis]|uniref:Uncharacterized protein n=1 Tax=Caenorhabditis bovis TaxID=2654633 RepID=A0A8S1FFH3_9PELO|nr:unnamed protein product [Caenorhabditis bovis]